MNSRKDSRAIRGTALPIRPSPRPQATRCLPLVRQPGEVEGYHEQTQLGHDLLPAVGARDLRGVGLQVALGELEEAVGPVAPALQVGEHLVPLPDRRIDRTCLCGHDITPALRNPPSSTFATIWKEFMRVLVLSPSPCRCGRFPSDLTLESTCAISSDSSSMCFLQ